MSAAFAQGVAPFPVARNDQRRPRDELSQELLDRLLIRDARNDQMKLPLKASMLDRADLGQAPHAPP